MSAQVVENQTNTSFYAQHLAVVNACNPVTTVDDVHNDKGALLVGKGNDLSLQVVNKIKQHKLLRPIEHCVRLGNSVCVSDIENQYIQLLNSTPDLKTLIESTDLPDIWRASIKMLEIYPITTQKITVLKFAYPEIFKANVFSAMLSTLFAYENEVPQDQIIELFCAALLQDIGLLHIDPKSALEHFSLLHVNSSQYHSHPNLAFDVLKSIDGLPRSIPNIVLEHEELKDGTGFPQGLQDKFISPRAAYLSLANECFLKYLKCLHPRKFSFFDIKHALHFFHGRWEESLLNSAFRIFSSTHVEKRPVVNFKNYRPVQAKLKSIVDRLGGPFTSIYGLSAALPKQDPKSIPAKIWQRAQDLAFVTASTGILTKEHNSWLAEELEFSTQHGHDLEEAWVYHVEFENDINWIVAKLENFIAAGGVNHNAELEAMFKIELAKIHQHRQQQKKTMPA